MFSFFFFFFNDTATTEIYTLSLHDALPIFLLGSGEHLLNDNDMRALGYECAKYVAGERATHVFLRKGDRKSTRLNSSHSQISYAVFCLKKKKIRTSNFRVYGTSIYFSRL